MHYNIGKESITRLFVLLVLVFSSCMRDGENLDECIRSMRIELRWINTQPQSSDEKVAIGVFPSSFGTRVDLESDIYGVDVDLLTDGYNIVGWEDHSNTNIDVTNHTISVETSSDGMALSPNIFSAGFTHAEVTLSDANQVIPLPMYRQVRPVVIEINFIGDGYALVSGVTGTLKGIALERSLDNGFPPVSGLGRPAAIKSGNINYTFGLSDQAEAGIWYTGTQNLIGIDGNVAQTLDLEVSFTGESTPSPYSFDVTNQMAEYHTNKVDEPWYIIITLNLGANLEIDIVDWIAGPESWVTAH